jgi:hypothetical protein
MFGDCLEPGKYRLNDAQHDRHRIKSPLDRKAWLGHLPQREQLRRGRIPRDGDDRFARIASE